MTQSSIRPKRTETSWPGDHAQRPSAGILSLYRKSPLVKDFTTVYFKHTVNA